MNRDLLLELLTAYRKLGKLDSLVLQVAHEDEIEYWTDFQLSLLDESIDFDICKIHFSAMFILETRAFVHFLPIFLSNLLYCHDSVVEEYLFDVIDKKLGDSRFQLPAPLIGPCIKILKLILGSDTLLCVTYYRTVAECNSMRGTLAKLLSDLHV